MGSLLEFAGWSCRSTVDGWSNSRWQAGDDDGWLAGNAADGWSQLEQILDFDPCHLIIYCIKNTIVTQGQRVSMVGCH